MLDCGEILDIAHIQQWHANAISQLDAMDGDVTINVSALQKIDTAGIQALAAVVKHVEARGDNITWSELSPAFINAATLLGSQEELRMRPQQ